MATPSRRKKWHGYARFNDATPVSVKAAVTGKTIYVTKATLSINTHANGKFGKLRDSVTNVVVAAHTDATAAAKVPSTVTWDFGKDGFACTANEGLEVVSEASGPAGLFYAEGYTVSNT